MILVDTSVWIDHLRVGEQALVDALEIGEVLIHPFVIGELACGNLRNRGEILGLLSNLPSARQVSNDEAMFLLDSRSLMGRGIGYIDIHLLASTLLEGTARLWTRDRRLHAVAKELSVTFAT